MILIELIVVAVVFVYFFNAARISYKQGGKKEAAKFVLDLGLQVLAAVLLFKLLAFSAELFVQAIIFILVVLVIYWIIQITKD